MRLPRLLSAPALLAIGSAALAQPAAPPVVVAQVELAQEADELVLSGTATARRNSRVSPPTDGLVTEVLVDVGDRVKKGQALVRLDKVIAEHELATAQAALDEGLARLADAQRKRDEAAEVHARALIADTVYESAVAEASIQAAAVERLRAEYERRRELLDRHTVRAPFAGIVARKMAEAGQWTQRSEALLEVVDTEVLRVDVAVPQDYFADVQPGTPASIRFDAMPDEPIETRVTTRVAVGDPAARTFLARIELANPGLRFTPGMSARVVLRPGGQDGGGVLRVPRDALLRLADGSYRLWRIQGETGAPVARPVSVEVRRFAGRFAVLAPGAVEAGERVVVRGNESLRPDQPVQVVAPAR
jgi:membrane fusion protein (multidrug efflux system)